MYMYMYILVTKWGNCDQRMSTYEHIVIKRTAECFQYCLISGVKIFTVLFLLSFTHYRAKK